MKRKIVLLLVLYTVICTSCNLAAEQTVSTLPTAAETSETAISEIAESAETEQTTKAASGYDVELPENMRIFNFAKLGNQKGEFISKGGKQGFLLNGNILCAACRITNSDGTVASNSIRFYNISDETVEKTIPLPGSYGFEEFIGSGEGILCKIKLSHYPSRNGVVMKEYSVMTVTHDYNYELSEFDKQTAALPEWGHNISHLYLDIYDADRDITLMEGRSSENIDDMISNYRYHVYMFPIDENRFVYLTGGYEYTSCFGIYDFRTDTAADLEDTEDMRPLGIHEGKIYSAYKPWAKTDSDIYVTDMETLETVKAMDCPKPLSEKDMMYYAMPESGDRIICMYSSWVKEITTFVGVIDPDGENDTVWHEIPYKNEFYEQMYLTDSGNVVIISRNMDKAVIIDI